MLLVIGCGGREAVQLSGDEQVLARVNDSPITAYDVQQSMARTFGAERSAELGATERRRVIESLVTSRAIAQRRERELGAQQRAELDRKVAAYREELLVMQYLAEHTPPEPPSAAAVEKYYREHPEQFGASKLRRYELVTSERELSSGERDKLLPALARAKEQKDWGAWVGELRKQGAPIVHSAGREDERLLHASLRARLSQLAAEEASELTFLESRPYLVRVTTVEDVAPRPLAEVRAQIVETLSPLQIKDAVERAQRKVLPHARVEYQK